MATSVSKLRDQLEQLTGVDIMLDDNTFKSTYQIIKEISEVWGDLSDVSQANVLNLLGGKRNANSIASLLENFATAEEALAAAQNSAGSAAQENEKYLDSITGKLQVLHANFQAMSSTVMNSDVVAFFIDLLSGLTSVITAIQKVNMLLPLVIASVTVIKGLVGASKIQSISQQIGMLVRRGTDASQIFGMMSTQLGTLSQKQLLAVANTVALNSGIQGGAKNAAEGTIAHMLYAEATRQAGDASAIAAGKFSLLQASIPVIGIALTGLTLIMGLITTATNGYNTSVQQSIDKAKQADQAYKTNQETLAGNLKTLQGIKKRYEELAKGVDENGQNVSLTAAEYEEFQSLLQQIVDISPDIVSGYENQAYVLKGSYVEAVNAAIAAQKELEEQQKRTAIGEHGESYFSGKKNEYNQAVTDMKTPMDDIAKLLGFNASAGYSMGALNVANAKQFLEILGQVYDVESHIQSDFFGEHFIFETSDLIDMYDHLAEISTLMSANGYTKEQVSQFRTLVLSMGPYISTLREVTAAEANWLVQRVALDSSDSADDWFGEIPTESLATLNNIIAASIDPTQDYYTQLAQATSIARDFGQVMALGGTDLISMVKGLKDGSVTIDEYNQELEAFRFAVDTFNQGAATPIPDSVINGVFTWLTGLSNAAQKAKEAEENVDNYSETVTNTKEAMTDLSDVLKNAASSFDLLNKAEAEMTENGKLSASTVQSIVSALQEGESITDYLTVQDGAIIFNAEAWKTRSENIIKGLRDEMIASKEALKAETALLGEQPGTPENAEQIRKNLKAIEDAEAAIAIYDALLAEMSNPETAAYDFSATIKGLDEIQKKGKQIYDWITALNKEGAKALNPTDLLAAFPELAGQDLSTIEAQKTALEGLATTYETKYTGAIDKAIEAVEALQQAILAENNVDSKESLAGEALEEYKRLGEYVTALQGIKGFSLSSLFFGSGSDTVSPQEYTSMLKNAESLAGILGVIFGEQDSSNGANTISTLQELSKLLGEDWDESKFVTFFEDGSFQINTDALTDYIVQTIMGSEATDELKTAMLALLSSGAAEKIASDAEKMSDAVSAASDSFDILKTATEEMGKDGSNGISSKTFMSILKELGEDESISDYLYTENGLLKLNTEAWLARSEAIITSQREVVQANVDAAKAENKKLQAEIEANLDAMYSFDPSEDNYAFYEELEQRNKELQAKIDANNQIIADGTVQIDIYDTALQQLADDLAGGNGDTLFKTALGDLKEMREESKGLFDVLEQLTAKDAKPLDYTTLITQFPELRKYQASELDTVEEQITAINALIATRQAEYEAAIDAQIGILQARKATLDAEKDAAEITDIDTAIAALTNMKGVTLTALFGDPGEVEEAKDTIVDAFGKVASATSLMKEAAQDSPDWLQIVEYAQKMAEVLGEGHAWTEFLTLNYDEAGNVSGITLAQTAIDGYIDSVVNATITEEQFGDQTDAVRAYFKGLLEEEARVEEETLKLSDALSNLKTGISFMDSVKSGEGDVMSMLESAIKFAETMDNVSVADLINGFTFVDGALTGIDWNTEAIDGYVDSMVDAFIAASGLGEVYPELAEKLKAYIRATQEATDATEAMSAALNNAAKRMDLLKDIREDMESGGLTQETISSMIGALDEGESIVDYIYEENGALKVNIDLWERRARAKLASERADADKRVKDLETEIATMEDVVTRYEDLYATRDKLNQWFTGDDETRESLNLPGVGYAGNWDKDAAEEWYYEVDNQIALLEDAYGSYEEVKDKWIRLEDEFTEAKGVRDIYDVLLGEFGEAPDDKVADALDALDEIQDKFKKAYDWAKDISSGKLIDTNDLATALNAANVDYSQWNLTSLAGQRQAVEALKQAYQDLYNVQLGSSTSVLQARRDELEAQETLTEAESQELVAIKSVLTLLGSMGTTTLDEIFSFEPDTKKDLNDAVSAIENAKKLMTEAAKENADPFAMIETAKKMAEALGEGNAWYDFFNFSYDENGMLTGLTLIDEKVTEYTQSVIAAIVADEELEASFPGITAWLTQYAEDASAATQETKSLSDALGDVSRGISFLKQAKAGEDAFGTFQSAISFIESLDNVNVTDIISGFSGSGADFAINWNTTAIEEYIFSLIDASEAVSQVEAVYPGFTAALKESISASTEAEEATIELSDAMSLLSSAGSFLSNARSGEKGGFEMINSAIQLADELNKAIPGATYTWSSFVDSIDASGVTWNLSSIEAAISSLATALVNSGVILEENKEAFIAWAKGVATAEEITVESAMNSVQSASELIQTIGKEIAEDGANSYGTLLKVMALLGDKFSEDMVIVDEATGKFTINSAAVRQWAQDILDSTDASEKMKKIAEDILALNYEAPEPTNAEKMETAIGQLEKYANILTTVEKEMAEGGGISAGTLQTLITMFGDKAGFSDAFFTDLNGNIRVNTEILRGWAQEVLSAEGMPDEWVAWAQSILDGAGYISEASTTISDAIGSLNAAQSLIKEMSSDSPDLLSAISSAQSMADTLNKMQSGRTYSWADFLTAVMDDGLVSGFELSKDAVYDYADAMIYAAAETDENVRANIDVIKQLAHEYIDLGEEAKDAADDISSLNSVISFMSNVKSGSNDVLGMMSTALQLAQGANVPFQRLFQGFKLDAGGNIVGMNWDVSVVDTYRDSLIQSMLAAMGLTDETGELASALRNYIDAASDASEKTFGFSDALSGISGLQGILQGIVDGDTDQFSMIQKASELATQMATLTGDTNASWKDFLNFTAGKGYEWNTDRLEVYRSKLIETAGGVENLSDAEKEWLAYLTTVTEAVEDASAKLNDLNKVVSFMTDVKSGNNDVLGMLASGIEMAGQMGVSLRDIMSGFTIDANGAIAGINWDTSLIDTYTDALIQNMLAEAGVEDETGELAAKLREYVDAASEAAKETQTFNDALSSLSSFPGFMQQVNNGEMSQFEMIRKATELASQMAEMTGDTSASWRDFLTFTSGKGFEWDVDRIEAYRTRVLETAEAMGGLSDEERAWLDFLTSVAEEAENAAGRIDELNGVISFMTNIKTGNNDILGMISSGLKMADQMGVSFQQIFDGFTFDAAGAITGLNWDTSLVDMYTDSLIQNMLAAAGVEDETGEVAKALRAYIDAASEASEETSNMSDAMSALSSMNSFLSNARSGDSDGFGMINSAIKIAEELNSVIPNAEYTWFSFVSSMDANGVTWNLAAIEQAITAFADSLVTKGVILAENKEAFIAWATGVAGAASDAEVTIQGALESAQSASELVQTIQQEIAEDGFNSYGTLLKVMSLLGDEFEDNMVVIDDVTGAISINAAAIRNWALDILESADASEKMKRIAKDMLSLDYQPPEPTNAEKMSEAISQLDKYANMLTTVETEMAENGGISADTLQTLITMFGDKAGFSDAFFTDLNGNLQVNTEMLRGWAQEVISAEGMPDEWVEWAQGILDSAGYIDDATTTISSAISSLSSAQSLVKEMSSNTPDLLSAISSAQSMADSLNQIQTEKTYSWADFLTKGVAGGFELSKEAVYSYADAMIEAAAETDANVQANIDVIKRLAHEYIDLGVEAKNAADDISGLNSVISFMTDIKSGSNDVLGMMSAALKLASDMNVPFQDLFQGFSLDASGHITGLKWDVSVVDAYRDSLVQSMLATMGIADETGVLTAALRDYIDAASDATKETLSFSDLISDLSGLGDLMQNIADDSMSQFDMIKRATELAARMIEITGDESVSWRDFLTFTEGKGYAWDTESIDAYRQSVIDAAGGVEYLSNAEKDWLEYLSENVDVVDDANEKLEKTIKSTQNAGKTLLDIQGEIESTGYNSLDTILSVMSLLGDKFDATTDIIDMGNGHFRLSEQAIMSWAEATIEASNAPDHLKQAMLQYLRVGYQYEAQVERMEGHFKNATDLIAGRGDITRDMELTYDQFSDLISISSEYMNAVEYGNGVLTLNKDKYDEITTSVIEQTRADAAAAAATRLYSQEYQTLMQQYKDGTIDEAGKQRLSTLQAEIMSYSVLVTELDNASSAYKRFLNASTNTSSGRYEAAGNALQVIQDTLYNAGSNVYGKRGREQYQSAVQFLISPDIEVDSDAWKDAMKTVERYVTDGQDGVTNFYNDLVQAGIVVDGQMDTTIGEVASKLGISEELTRTMFDELNQYLETPLTFKNADTSGIEGIGDSAEAAKTPLETLMEKLDQVETSVNALNEGEIAISANPAISSVNTLNQSLDRTANTIDKINRKRINIEAKTTSQSGGLFSGIGNIVSNIFGASEAGGSYATKGGKTLVGELGPEVVVDPKEGQWRVVGQQGAEFINMPKNAIVFNAEQTRRLFSDGSIKGIGTAMASGTGDFWGNLFTSAGATVGNVTATLTTSVLQNVADALSGAVSGVKGTGVSSSNVVLNLPKQQTYTGPAVQSLDDMKNAAEEADKQLEHLIRHQEHLYKVAEIGLDYPGMDAALTEIIRLYRLKMENAEKAVQDMLAAGADDTDENVQAMEEIYWAAYDNLYQKLEELNKLYTDALNTKIDDLQTAYSNLGDAMDEFNSTGGISVDTFQKLLDHGAEYLTFLQDEDGQLSITEDKLQALIAAEKERLAVEQAMAYIERVMQALADDDANLIAKLADVTQQIGDNTWDLVFAQLAALENTELTADQYAAVYHNVEMIRELAGLVNDETRDSAESMVEVIDDLIDRTKELIKFEVDQQIQAIKDQIDEYKELINLKKEALKTAKEEEKYEKGVADRVKEIATMQAKIDQLALDDSREAAAQRAKLLEQLADKQESLSEYQADHAYDAQIDALDKMADTYEESRQPEIDALERSISSEEKLYQAALKRIETGWDTLFSELIAWNTEEGRSLNSEIVETWEAAAAAVAKYGSYREALAHYKEIKGTHLETVEIPKFHGGGIVPNSSGSDDEVLAMLQKGEMVLDDSAKKGLYSLVDFPKYVAERFGVAVDAIRDFVAAVPNMIAPIATAPAMALAGAGGGMVINNEFTVSINHNGSLTDGDARRYGRQIADAALGNLYDAFERRGITRASGKSLS